MGLHKWRAISRSEINGLSLTLQHNIFQNFILITGLSSTIDSLFLIKYWMTRWLLENFVIKLWNFTFPQTRGLVQVKLKNIFESSIILSRFLDLWKSKIYRPMMHFFCGSEINNLTFFKDRSDNKHYQSACKMKYGTAFYSPKNTSEAFKIFQKYRKGTYLRNLRVSLSFSIKLWKPRTF